MVSATPVALRALLRDAPRSLAVLSHEHRDGWGVATACEGAWTVHRSVECAAESARFAHVASSIESQLVVAHVRQRTVGATSLENTHPFQRAHYVLAHNGTVSGVRLLESRTSRERLGQIEGETDSEKLFAFLMTRIDESGCPEAGVGRAARDLRGLDGIGTVNFLLSDGSSLFAFRQGRGLFVLDRTRQHSSNYPAVMHRSPGDEGRVDVDDGGVTHAGRDRRYRTPTVIVASEPLTAEPWIELREGTLLRISRCATNPEVRAVRTVEAALYTRPLVPLSSPPTNPSTLGSIADFLLRLVFFAAAPFLLVYIAEFFPVSGAIIQVLVALVVFFTAETVRRFAARSALASFALRRQLAFEAYYREHRPRPFLYYIFYPVLFPYWLVVRDARQEFLLYKGYTFLTFSLLIVSLVSQYRTNFPPDLKLHDFWPIAAGSLIAEAVVVLMFLMPIVTTVVHFHTERSPKRLFVLLAVGIVSVGIAVWRIEQRRDPIVSYATRARVRLRTEARPADASKAQLVALKTAWKALPASMVDIDTDGKVQGVSLEKARLELAKFYKLDEAHAFDLWYTLKNRHGLMVVYFEARQSHPPIWLAMDDAGHTIHDKNTLPRGAFNAMKLAAE